jgi:hypothetical protein
MRIKAVERSKLRGSGINKPGRHSAFVASALSTVPVGVTRGETKTPEKATTSTYHKYTNVSPIEKALEELKVTGTRRGFLIYRNCCQT